MMAAREKVAGALALIVALAFACLLAFAAPLPAWAEDVDEGNLVNPRQIPDSSFIYDTLMSDLEKADAYMDGQTVQITGEAVGDCIRAELDPDHCWLTLEAIDGSHAMVAVFATRQAADLVDAFGKYGQRGTILRVRGTFNLACSKHEGQSDLHAELITVESPGQSYPDEPQTTPIAAGIALGLVGITLALVYGRMRERRR